MTLQEVKQELQNIREAGGKPDLVILYIHMPDGETEIIINPKVDEKMEYIEKAYDENLYHKNGSGIYIEDVIFSCENDTLDFGAALEEMKRGKRAARKGWHAEGMYLYYVPDGRYKPCTEVAEALVGEDGRVQYGEYIAINTAKDCVVPWVPSQTDMLAEDWYTLTDAEGAD